MYKIAFTRQAAQALKAMPRNLALTIRSKIDALAENPCSAPNVKKLIGREGYRLRVGNWRILYELNDAQLVIVVLAVKPRGGAYT
jgi:mRNA interferase RelE/StbE